MSAFEMGCKIYQFELFCDKTFVPFLTLTRNNGKCFLTANYSIVTSLALVSKQTRKQRRILRDEKHLLQEKFFPSSVRQKC